jgi:hypothetical protein
MGKNDEKSRAEKSEPPPPSAGVAESETDKPRLRKRLRTKVNRWLFLRLRVTCRMFGFNAVCAGSKHAFAGSAVNPIWLKSLGHCGMALERGDGHFSTIRLDDDQVQIDDSARRAR